MWLFTLLTLTTFLIHISNSLAAFLFSNVRTCTRRCVKHVGPIIEERRKKQQELGNDWVDKPVCVASSLFISSDNKKISTLERYAHVVYGKG